jgi:tetratricopeptide (TPR) repeat protein
MDALPQTQTADLASIERLELLLARRQFAESITLAENMLKTLPGDIQLLEFLANACFQSGLFQKAEKICNEILNENGDNRPMLFVRAKTKLQQAKPQSAQADIDKYCALNIEDTEGLYWRGLTALENGWWNEALESFDRVKHSGKEHFEIDLMIHLTRHIIRLSRISVGLLLPAIKRFVLKQIARFAEQKNRIYVEEACYRLLIHFGQDTARFCFVLGEKIAHRESLHFSRHDDVVRLCYRSLEANPNDPSTYWLLGKQLYDQGCYEAACVCFERAIFDERFNHAVRVYMANSLVALDRSAEAADLYKRYLEMNPDDSACWLNLISVELELNQYSDALENCRKALKHNKHNVFLLYFEKMLEHTLEFGIPGKETCRDIFDKLNKTHNWEHGIYSDTIPGSAEQTDSFVPICCPVCDSNDHKDVWNNGWPIVKCSDCGLIYVNPQPTPEFLYNWYNTRENQYTAMRIFFRKLLNRIQQAPKEFAARWLVEDGLIGFSDRVDFASFETSCLEPRKMIDLGAAVGWQVYSFQVRGWHAEGLEISKTDVEYGTSKGIRLRQGTIETVDLPDNTYDLVIMTHTIEHVPNPLDVMIKAKRILKPGGLLVVSTPCADSLPYYWCGPKWLVFGEHVLFFSRKNLIQLFEKAGLQVIDSITYCGAPTLESFQPDWKPSGFNKRFVDILNQQDQGDVLAVFGTKSIGHEQPLHAEDHSV